MSTHSSVLTVSQLNRQVKKYLENELGTVHVEGEISNFSKPSSGHFYFSLKDTNAQIRCVFFKNRYCSSSTVPLTNGQKIVASGTLSLYEARGDYQLIIENITAAGIGELYQRFEALKNKLASEGLFHASRKKNIPLFPSAIGVITSTTGAAIRDILSTLSRRFPLAQVVIYPSEVQGATASLQLIKALHKANQDKRCDVLIIARGGGSIEDLWAFNDEELAREIAHSLIPIVSGVGHETDFTMADFVADYRAETPTAAAIAVTPNQKDLMNLITTIMRRLHSALNNQLRQYQARLNYLKEKISSTQRHLTHYWQHLDFLERQLRANQAQIIRKKTYQLDLSLRALKSYNPQTKLYQTQVGVQQLRRQLEQMMRIKLKQWEQQLNAFLSTLHAVSPLATLDRGYAIASKNQHILFSTQQVDLNEVIEVRLAQGSLACQVIRINEKKHV